MTLGEALRETRVTLARAGVERPGREARLLAAHLLGVSPTAWLDEARLVDGDRLAAMAGRRAAREPLAFITGRRGFWTLDLHVSPDTLIPRPDSEALIEAALAALPLRQAVRRILDLGTGTGCLLLASLSEFTEAFGVGVDLAPSAVALARRNAAANGLADRAAFLAGDWGDAIAGRFDLLLCNPPYIATGDLPGLAPELRHEPVRALDGGPGGLAAYARLLPALPALLEPGGLAVLEIGVGQGPDIVAMAARSGLCAGSARADLAGVERALVFSAGVSKKTVWHAARCSLGFVRATRRHAVIRQN